MSDNEHNMLSLSIVKVSLIIQHFVNKVNSLLSSSLCYNYLQMKDQKVHLFKYLQAVSMCSNMIYHQHSLWSHRCCHSFLCTNICRSSKRQNIPVFFPPRATYQICNLCQATSSAYSLWTEASSEPPQTLNHNLHVFRISHSSRSFNIHTRDIREG